MSSRKLISIFLLANWQILSASALTQTFTTKDEFSRGVSQDTLITDGFGGEITLEPKIAGLSKSGFFINKGFLFGNIHSFGLVSYGNQIILLGGKTQGDASISDVQSATIGSGGVINNVHPLTPLPFSMANQGCVLVGNSIYILAPDGSQRVYRGVIENDGSITNWNEELKTPFKIFESDVVTVENRLYVFSKSGDGRIIIGTLNPDGSINSWKEQENKISVVKGFAVYAYKNGIYISGGVDKFSSLRREAFLASVNSDGSLGNYLVINQLPIGISSHAMYVKDGTVFIVGGLDGFKSRGDVFSGKIGLDGQINTWDLEQVLPTELSNAKVYSYGKYFYVVGGKKLSFDSDLSRATIEVISQPSPVRIEKPIKLSSASLIASGGKMYRFGGRDGLTISKTVEAASIDGNGVIGDFKKLQDLPKYILPLNLLPHNDRIYMVGSNITGDTTLYSVRSVLIDSNGEAVDYRVEKNLPTSFSNPISVIYKDTIYTLRDGFENNVVNDPYSLRLVSSNILQDGSLDKPQKQKSPPVDSIRSPNLAIWRNRIYFYGAGTGTIFDQNAFYSAEIDSSGNIGDWRTESYGPSGAQSGVLIRVVGDYMYFIGGKRLYDTPLVDNNKYVAHINTDGTIGSWVSLGETQGGASGTTDWNGRLYFGLSIPVASENPAQFGIASAGQPQYGSGFYVSPVYDLSSPRSLRSVSWKKELNPEGSKLSVSFSCGVSSSSPMSDFVSLANGNQTNNYTCRYVQYKVNMDVGLTSKEVPSFEEVRFVDDPDYVDGTTLPKITVSSVTSDSISISLIDSSLGEDRFVISVSTSSGASNSFRTITTLLNHSSETISIELTGLKSQKDYFIRARALNSIENVYGPFSDEVSTKTLIKVIDVPTGLHVYSNKFDISWVSTSAASCYKVFDDKNNLLKILTSTETAYSELNQNSNERLIRQLKGCTDDADILIGSFDFYTGIIPPSVDNVNILEKGNTSVTLSFKPPPNASAGKTSASIQIINTANPLDKREIVLKGPEYLASVQGLSYGQTYNFIGSYINGDGITFSSENLLSQEFGLTNESVDVQQQKFIVSQGINFVFNSNSPVSGSIKIYNVNQELIRELSVDVQAGPSNVFWDGKDQSGSYVLTDIYWAIVDTDKFGKKVIYVAAIR